MKMRAWYYYILTPYFHMLNWLARFAEVGEALVAILTLGFVNTGWHGNAICRITYHKFRLLTKRLK